MELFYTFDHMYSATKTTIIIIKIIRGYNNKPDVVIIINNTKYRLQKDTIKSCVLENIKCYRSKIEG